MDTRREKLEALKKEKNAVIMAHYYVPDEVQEIADYIGDSYYLSDVATKVDASVIVLCGVRFMGESAKILNPGKKVLLPDLHADCPMAHMAAIEKIEEVRKEYPDVAVVCYVNSTAELKSHSDVCVTSSETAGETATPVSVFVGAGYPCIPRTMLLPFIIRITAASIIPAMGNSLRISIRIICCFFLRFRISSFRAFLRLRRSSYSSSNSSDIYLLQIY